MNIIYHKAYCEHCNHVIRSEAKGANHVLHLLLSILTGGLWLIIWIGCALNKKYTCPNCGENVTGDLL